MGIRPQNMAQTSNLLSSPTKQIMPQTSNSLLSPTKSMVARATNGNHGQTVMHLQCSEIINHI